MDGHGHGQGAHSRSYAARHHPANNALPSITSLTNGIPPTSQPSPHAIHHHSQQPPRDSGAFVGSQSSKHTSANSGLHVSTLLNHDDSHPRQSHPTSPSSTRLSQPGSQLLPSINQSFEPTNVQRDSYASYASHNTQGTHESSRSSVDSRMHSGMGGLALSHHPHTSPYGGQQASQHPSQVSLAASLRRPDSHSQLSPISARATATQRLHEQSTHTRVAPPIVPNPRQYGAPDPHAVKPTQGFPWAFPDTAGPSGPDDRRKRRASSSDSSETNHQKISRQNSFATSSVRSSAISGDIAMPAGQRRFEEGMAFQKIIGPPSTDVKHAQSESPHISNGSMQHRSVTQLQNEHMMNGISGGYSRTPELRVSHKLAERKRRSEMKDLFEDLNKAVPSNAGAKSSKWEILSKAIDHIRMQRDNENMMHNEMSRLRIEVEKLHEIRSENEQLKVEGGVMHARLQRLEPHEPHIYGGYTSQLAQSRGNGQNGPPQSSGPPTSAPPSHPQDSHPGGLPSVNSSHSHSLQHSHPQRDYHSQHPPAQQHGYYQQASSGGHMQGVEYSLPTRPGYDGR